MVGSGDSEGPAEARIAGIAYIVTIACGLFAEAYARGAILVAGDPIRTTANMRAFDGLYRWGMLADCVMIASYVVVTALLYRLLRTAGRAMSLTAALFSMTGLALLAAMTALLAVPLQLHDPARAYDVLRLHAAAYNLADLFFGIYCLLIGWLILRSRRLPRAVGGLMALAGAVFVADAALTIVAPGLARQIPGAVMLVSLIGEGSLALWLAVFGVRQTTA